MTTRQRTSLLPAVSLALEPLEERVFLSASSTRIMALGDSITAGVNQYAGYRYYLYKSLVAGGYDFDFVGSQTLGWDNKPAKFSDFDADHEGHGGYRADDIASRAFGWAQSANPDVVLLHIGTNDATQNQSAASTITDISNIINALRAENSNITIVLAQIIPCTTRNDLVQQENALLPGLVSQMNTSKSPILLVDQYTGFNVTADTWDGGHPNDTGEPKIAAKFYSALQTVLPKTLPPAPTTTTYLNTGIKSYVDTNGWGPVETDKSVGESNSGDGKTLTLNGTTFAKGLGVHAGSEIRYKLLGNYSSFTASVGVDDEVGSNGSVVFQVYLDDVKVFDSGTMTGSTATKSVNVDVTGKQILKLVVTDAGNGNTSDHADWADAKLAPLGAPPVDPPPVDPPPAGTVYLSSVTPTTSTNGWGAYEKDQSNGEQGSNDGKTITLNGATFAKGLGVHANSELVYPLGGNYTRFFSQVGLDDEVGSNGLGRFFVYADGVLLFDSGNVSGASATQTIDVDVTGKSSLRLVFSDAGNGANFDHGDWAAARLTAGTTPPPPPPPTGTQTYVSDLSPTTSTNGWGSIEKDKSNGEANTGDGKTITLNGTTYAKGLGVHAASSITYNLASAYTTFSSDIGVDDEVGNNGSVVFQVFADGVKIYDSGTMTGSTATRSINLSVLGKSTLTLVVTNGGNNADFDHADWAGAVLIA